MAQYFLGDFQFVAFHRPEDPAAPPQIVQPEVETVERKGVNGTGVLRTGKRGKPFQMVSRVDAVFLNVSQAQDAYAAYIGARRYDLIWAGTNFTSDHSTKYMVLDVQVTKFQRFSAGVGGLNNLGGGGYWVEAMWTLLPVPSG